MTQPRFSRPESKTRDSHPGSEYWLTMTTPMSGWALARCPATRTPSSVPVGGIRTSVTTTSGRASSIAARSVGSSSAVATTSMSGERLRICSNTSRTATESSASTTRIGTASRMLTSATPSDARRSGLRLLDLRPRGRLREEHQGGFDAFAHVLRVRKAQLEEDRVDVLLHRPLREEERLRDRRVALALGDLAQHLPLASRQLVEWRAVGRRPRPDEAVDDLRVDHRSALGHGVDRRRQLRPIVHPLFEQVRATVGAVVEQRQRVDRIRELAENHHADIRVALAQVLGQPDPLVGLRRGHPDVGDDDVGMLALAGLAQGVAVPDGRDDLDLGIPLEQLADPLADDEVVLSQRDADRHGTDVTGAGSPMRNVHRLSRARTGMFTAAR